MRTKSCGTGRPFSNRTPSLAGPKDVPPRLFWAMVGSGLSLRRGAVGWRFDCPRDRAHTVTASYRKQDDRTDGVVYVCCHASPDPTRDQQDAAVRRGFRRQGLHRDPALGCSTLAVLTALGCSFRDLYHQTTAAADGPCVTCGLPGYRVAGVARGRPVCLRHLLVLTHQPHNLLFVEDR